jgi:hypothetical protein
MQTLFGTADNRPTPDEIQAIIRRAHIERAQVLRQALSALFSRRRSAEARQSSEHSALRRVA